MPKELEKSSGATIEDGAIVAFAEEGRILLAGDPSAVDRYIAELKPERELDLTALAPLATGVGSLVTSDSGAVAKRYVELGAQRWKAISGTAHSDGFATEVREITKNLKTGKIVANKAVSPTKAALATQPEVLVAMAALQMAIQSVADAVEDVAKNVDDLKRIAETTEIGNLAGLYRVLANARAQVDKSGTISRTTWESIATHEVTAQQSADRLRAYLRRVVEDLPLGDDTGDRLDAARRLAKEGSLRRCLKLLVLAEQCRLLWRSLKLDEVRAVEPESLDAEAEAAKAMLAENAHADRELIASLREAIGQLTRVTALDGVRLVARSKLPAAGVDLRAQVDEFATARAQQLDSWAPGSTPGIRDAAREAQIVAAKAAVKGRRAVGGWVAGLGSRIQGAPDPDAEAGSSGAASSDQQRA